MRPKGTPEALEARRRQAMKLLKQGLTVTEVAQQIGSSHSSVIRWRDMVKKGGQDALNAQPHPHRPCRLSCQEKKKLLKLLLLGPVSHGYPDQLWTLPRIAKVIEKHFDITYHPAHVWKILRSLGWSCQKPETRAREQDEKAVALWRKQEWPHIKKRPQGKPQHYLH